MKSAASDCYIGTDRPNPKMLGPSGTDRVSSLGPKVLTSVRVAQSVPSDC